MSRQDDLKQMAAAAAVDRLQSGMVVGLGTGSTTRFALERIAELIRAGRLERIIGIPSSIQTETAARELGIPLSGLEAHAVIDITIDGADEVDPDLNLIKGGGGALLREKVLAQASRRNIIIVDASKLSERLGTRWALPVEVVPFARAAEERFLASLGAAVALRTRNSIPVLTDQGNLLLDARFGPITEPGRLAAQLSGRAGIVEHGLFVGLAHEVFVAGADGIRHLQRNG
ncbi:MAG: ribose-5-phosphate isomerase RpiA [Desulfobacterales bacterium]|jgi:ribose 5-phosphate isomerase A|nr:ribose-5-phosphate isomerase RpiA [Desulfobacterales bacterium]